MELQMAIRNIRKVDNVSLMDVTRLEGARRISLVNHSFV